MNNNLSLIGSEVINGNNNFNNISSYNPINTEQRVITKSYNLIKTPLKEKISKNNNNYIEKKSSETNRGNSFDLSKIRYNDGYILTDAVNSNPGFGLWAIKGSSKKEINANDKIILPNKSKIHKIISNQKKENNPSIPTRESYQLSTNNIPNNTHINNISTIKNNLSTIKNNITINNNNNDKSINSFNTINNNDMSERNIKNKKKIDELTMKCNYYEQKIVNITTDYEQKENLCKNDIKIKNEYEKMLQDNLEETNIIKEEYKKLSLDNSKLNYVFKKTKNELERLLDVMKTDNNMLEKIKEEFENRLKNEEIERERLNNIININEKEIESLKFDSKNIKKRNSSNIANNKIINKDSSKIQDLEIDNLNDVILELEIKISNLKKKISKADEENDKLRNVLKYKEQKEEIEKNNIINLYNLIEFTKKNQIKENNIITEHNHIFKNKDNNNNLTRKNNKISKSLFLKKVKFKD